MPSIFLMKTTTDTESIVTQLSRARFQLNVFFHIITTIRYALLPAMNKSLYAALLKVCSLRPFTSRGFLIDIEDLICLSIR
jgi:hypothetical protein